MKPVTNLSASIHQKLLNQAKALNKPFNELLILYAIERFIYRVGKSPYKDNFILKGAAVFIAWHSAISRPTRDIDFLSYGDPSASHLEKVIGEICGVKVEPDGLVFDPGSTRAEVIKEGADYEGVRVQFDCSLGSAAILMRVDIGFGDALPEKPKIINYPTLLQGTPAPRIRIYSPESVFAEKYHTMVVLGEANSRMKDFYDMWWIIHHMKIYPSKAIQATFKRRSTPIPAEIPSALTAEFSRNKQAQWAAFLKKNRLDDAPKELESAAYIIRRFIFN